MGILENIRAKREAKKQQEIEEEMRKIEQRKGKRLNEKGIEKVIKRVEVRRTRKSIRNVLFAILGSIGLATFGPHLLTDGNNDKELDSKTNIEMENENNTITNKRDEYLKELQDMNGYGETEILEENAKDTHIIDEILEAYNENLYEQARIDKEDLGIIKRPNDGYDIVKEVSKENGVSYIFNTEKTFEDLTKEQEWLKDVDIGTSYVLVDTTKENTIAGITIIDGKYCEVEAEMIRNRNDNTVYTENEMTYVGLPDGIANRQTYENFENYYQERLEIVENREEDEER